MSKAVKHISWSLRKFVERIFSHFVTFSIQIKLFISSILITLLVIATVFYVFQTFILGLVVEQQAVYSLNSYDYANQTMKSSHDELEVSVKGLNNSEILANILRNHQDGENILNLGNNVTNIEAEINRVFPRQNRMNNVIFVGVNRSAYIYSKSNQGQYLGKIADFEKFYAGLSTLINMEEESLPVFSLVPDELKSGDMSEAYIYRLLDNQIILIRTLKDFKNEMTGLVAITMNTGAFFEVFSRQDDQQTIMIMDKRDKLIWSNQDLGEYAGLLDSLKLHNGEYQTRYANNQRILCIYHNLQPFQFQVISFIPYDRIQKGSLEINLLIGIYGGICIVYVLLMSYLYSRNISAPINGLLERLKKEIREGAEKNSYPQVPQHGGKSLRRRLVNYFVLSTILPNLIFATISFNGFYNFYKEKVVYYSSNTLKLVKHYFESKIEEYDLVLKQVAYNRRVQEILQKLQSQPLLKQDTEFISNLLLNMKTNRKEQINVALYDPKGDLIYSTEYFSMNRKDPVIEKFKTALEESVGELNFLGIGKNYYLEPEMSFARKIRYINSYGGQFAGTIGYIKIGISYESVERIVTKAREDLPSHIVVTDSKMNYFAFDDLFTERLMANNGDFFKNLDDRGNTFRYDDRNYMAISENGQAYDIGYIKIISEEGLRQKLAPFYKYSVIIALVIAVLILANSYFIYSSILNPLKKILSDMQNVVEDSGKPIRTNVFLKDEISYISMKINELLGEINALMHENYEAKIREKELLLLQKEAQFAALQGQINPHFLYNTLESINWVAYKAGVNDICSMVSALGRFLRGALSSSKTVRIIDEVNHLNDYIFIQELRYKGRLQFVLDIREEIHAYKTLKLVLQPIVENAIFHGVDNMKNGGKILVRGYGRKASIVLSVRDNGGGMKEEKLKDVIKQLEGPPDNKSSIGLGNVYLRLRLYFGENFRMQIKSKAGKGTVIRLIIPAAE